MFRALLLTPALLLAACDENDTRAAWREMRAAEGAITQQRAVPAAEIDMGGDLPDTPHAGVRAGEWKAWATRAWPAACARLRTIKRTGRVPRDGRRCDVVRVAGIVPSAQVTVTGLLLAGGEKLPIGWTFTTQDVDRACAADPIDEASHAFRLTRSRPTQRWRATPLPVAAPIADDPVHAACADLPAFIARGS